MRANGTPAKAILPGQLDGERSRGRSARQQLDDVKECTGLSSNDMWSSAGSIHDISKYRDTCERSISILGGIAILRY